MLCQKYHINGPSTYYMQLYRYFLRQGKPPTNILTQCWKDLTACVRELQRKGHEIMVYMDANSNINDPNSNVSKFQRECNLSDPIIHYSPNQEAMETVKDGCARIDVCLVTPGVMKCIKTARHLAYDALTNTDHRALEITIDQLALFGRPFPDRTSKISRRLALNSPTKVKRYEKALQAQFSHHQIVKKISQLNEVFLYDRNAAIGMYEKLSNQIQKAQKHAEHQCGRLQYGHAWSPQLVEAGFRVTHWKHIVISMKSKRSLTETIYRNHKLISEAIELPCGYTTATHQLKKARKNLKEVQKHAQEIRENFLEDRAKFYAERNDKVTNNIIKQIKINEKNRIMYKKIQRTISKIEYDPLDHVLLPMEDGTWRRTETSEEMYEAIIMNNKEVLQSASSTLPGQPNMREFIGDFGDQDGARQILNGNFNILSERFGETIADMLMHLKRPSYKGQEVPEIESEITVKEFESLVKKTRESTASSPSGIHVGHYKVSISMSDIAATLTSMLSLPFEHGFSPKRWQASIHVMLEKIPGQPRVDKLRIIQLLEADFNIALKIKIGRQLMKHAEKHDLLGNQMHGGRRGHSTTTAIAIQTLTNDIAKQEGSCFVSMNLDATKCYDRIFPNLGGIALNRLGLARNFSICMAKTLKGMSHQIRTVYGVSNKSFRQAPHELWSGVGQGSAAAGPMWISQEAAMLSYYDTVTSGAEFHSIDKKNQYKVQTIGYIDDNNLLIKFKAGTNDKDISCHASHALQAWNDVLSMTGGQLSETKCKFHAVRWTPKKGRNKCKDIKGTIHFTNSAGQCINIQQAKHNETIKYLGIHSAPNGRNDI